jgi:hypothetical protein
VLMGERGSDGEGESGTEAGDGCLGVKVAR